MTEQIIALLKIGINMYLMYTQARTHKHTHTNSQSLTNMKEKLSYIINYILHKILIPPATHGQTQTKTHRFSRVP